MNHFHALSKKKRDSCVRKGIIKRVAGTTGFTAATVSRTFHGKFSKQNPAIVEAISRELDAMGISAHARAGAK